MDGVSVAGVRASMGKERFGGRRGGREGGREGLALSEGIGFGSRQAAGRSGEQVRPSAVCCRCVSDGGRVSTNGGGRRTICRTRVRRRAKVRRERQRRGRRVLRPLRQKRLLLSTSKVYFARLVCWRAVVYGNICLSGV